MASFLSDLFSVAKSKVLIIVLGIAKVIIIARYLGPELNGTLSALLVYPALLMSFGTLGIRKSSAFFLGQGTYTEDRIKQGLTQLWIFSSLICIAGSYILIRYFSESGDNVLWTWLAIIPLPFTIFTVYASGLFLGRNQIKKFNRVEWVPPLLIVSTSATLIIGFGFSVEGALIGEIAGPLFVSLMLLRETGVHRYFRFKVDWKIIGSLLSLGTAYALSLLLNNLNYRADIVILDKLSSSFEVGIYSKGAALIQYLWQIPLLLKTIVFARSATTLDREAFSLKVCQLLRFSLVVIGLGCIFLGLFSKPVILLLLGEEFLPSSTVLIYLIPGVWMLTLYMVLNMDISGRGKPWLSLLAMVPGLIVNVALNLILIPKYGANGASIASTVSYSLAAVIFTWVFSRETKIPVSQIFAYKKQDLTMLSSLFNKAMRKAGLATTSRRNP